jgi:hypothetical protein
MAKKEIETKTEVSTAPMTAEQRGIAERAAAQDTSWFTIREDELNDFSLQINPFSLKDNFPEAWRAQQEKQFAFRFCERTDRRIDELTRSVGPPLRWAICTRTTTPFLEKYVDPILGCIAVLDQVLLFKPYAHYAIVQRAKADLTNAKYNAGRPDAVATRNADPDKIKSYVGPEYKIQGGDQVFHEDTRQYSGESDLGDLVDD